MDEARARFLRDKVMTATPAQRVVMLYDRLTLDILSARNAKDEIDASVHLGHAARVVGELYSSLDVSVGGPADNLAKLYSFLLNELVAMRASGKRVPGPRLDKVEAIVTTLRECWVEVAAQVSAQAPSTRSLSAGAWVG